MKTSTNDLNNIQRLVLDILNVERNHSIPDTERHENVVEHSYSVAILCWKIYEATHPPLNSEKILKYSLSHDMVERGLNKDTNTYAGADERKLKKIREADEFKKISKEFENFDDLVSTISNYENMVDEETLFVWSVDKMQGIILGSIDSWKPYKAYGVTHEQFRAKGEEFLSKCSPYLKDIFIELHTKSCEVYYDQPEK
jgi:5'-deoxynucleotidase YfbR-like HD superfamily hydrolase